jgi:hypothetical protein
VGCVLDTGPVDRFCSEYLGFPPSLSLSSMLHTRFIRLPPRYIIEESSASSNKTRGKKN